jgi:2-C-methyl-D-erythritol 4-phosphate cytidylyltransferase
MSDEHQQRANTPVPVRGILLAAGRGRRFGGAKHHADLAGRPMWQRSRETLVRGGVDEVIVVGDFPGAIPGGERRRDSVAAALAVIPDDDGFVLVHDAARPLASFHLVRTVIDRLLVGDVAGVIPVVPVRDTIKQVRDGLVIGTIDRSELAAVQTPQGFRLAALRAAHAAVDGDATDDASMVEQMGKRVAVVSGEAGNIKVTYPEDLALVLALRSRTHE